MYILLAKSRFLLRGLAPHSSLVGLHRTKLVTSGVMSSIYLRLHWKLAAAMPCSGAKWDICSSWTEMESSRSAPGHRFPFFANVPAGTFLHFLQEPTLRSHPQIPSRAGVNQVSDNNRDMFLQEHSRSPVAKGRDGSKSTRRCSRRNALALDGRPRTWLQNRSWRLGLKTDLDRVVPEHRSEYVPA